ncbi:hypothetical protein JW835_04635, partial [bacterium]|nr:hypothetical protein [bacterium]
MDIQGKKLFGRNGRNVLFLSFIIIGWLPLVIFAGVDFVGRPTRGVRVLTVDFEDRSTGYNAPSYDREWHFEGGSPSAA